MIWDLVMGLLSLLEVEIVMVVGLAFGHFRRSLGNCCDS
jgi:hypothetical protein